MLTRATICAIFLLLASHLPAQTTATYVKADSGPTYSSSSSSNSYDTSTITSSATSEQWAHEYCQGHPGEDWARTFGDTTRTGHCDDADPKSAAVLNRFLSHNKKLAPTPANAQTLIAYVNYNKLNPREEKSYERAYKSLKQTGQLELR